MTSCWKAYLVSLKVTSISFVLKCLTKSLWQASYQLLVLWCEIVSVLKMIRTVLLSDRLSYRCWLSAIPLIILIDAWKTWQSRWEIISATSCNARGLKCSLFSEYLYVRWGNHLALTPTLKSCLYRRSRVFRSGETGSLGICGRWFLCLCVRR